jgi:hypothetical protein
MGKAHLNSLTFGYASYFAVLACVAPSWLLVLRMGLPSGFSLPIAYYASENHTKTHQEQEHRMARNLQEQKQQHTQDGHSLASFL